MRYMYSVRDSKSGIYMFPFSPGAESQQQSLVEATRAFLAAAAGDQSAIARYPVDHDLYYMGQYDPTRGKFTILENPEHVASAVTAKLMQKSSEEGEKK